MLFFSALRIINNNNAPPPSNFEQNCITSLLYRPSAATIPIARNPCPFTGNSVSISNVTLLEVLTWCRIYSYTIMHATYDIYICNTISPHSSRQVSDTTTMLIGQR